MIKDLFSADSKQFYRSLASLVIPITIQNLITSAVNSADVFMLGFVGQSALSAVSLANQVQFLLSGIFYGIASGIIMMCSQYWGKRDTDSVQVIMGIAAKLAFGICLIFSMTAMFAPDFIMNIYTNDKELIVIGAEYLRIIGISYLLMGLSQVYLSTLRSVERASVSMVISSSALLINIFLNAVLIFGFFGAPKLGVVGVAIATTVSRILEFALCMIHLFTNKVFRFKPSLFIKWDKVLFADYIKYSVPALINDVSWTFAFSTYSVIMGHLNADVVAANSVASTIRTLCSTVCFGIASGGTVLLGVRIGENNLEVAKKDASRLCRVTLLTSIITGLLIIAIRPMVFYFFDLTVRAQGYLNIMLFISSYYVIGQAMNTLTIAGIFRAGGDSRFGMICDTVTMWLVSVPLGFLAAFVLKLPPMVVYFILCLDEFWKIPVVYKQYKSYKWLRNITR